MKVVGVIVSKVQTLCPTVQALSSVVESTKVSLAGKTRFNSDVRSSEVDDLLFRVASHSPTGTSAVSPSPPTETLPFTNLQKPNSSSS